ncbi:MAG TPA: carbamoyltransferase HypF, partial [Thermodesulfobacterium geofontis]|nr:carbamoyltransferase HypF [Thermodesulfobacterium geofontis]
MLKHFHIRVNGIVQGVGFRPFIYRLALEHNIKGYVLNDTEGVTIEAEGEEKALKRFIKAIKEDFPPLAIVQEVKIEEKEVNHFEKFWIEKSRTTEKKITFIPPDTNICKDCLKEFFDPKDRRYHYPFIVCTHCGPRFSIVKDIPYDRHNTSMAEFPMCPECKKEYEDPLDRRFHT